MGIRLVFTKSLIDNVKFVACADIFSLVIKSDSTLWGSGRTISGQMGELIKTHTTYVTIPTKIESGVTDIEAEWDMGLFIKGGKLWGSGSNFNGRLGLGHTNNVYSFTPIPFINKELKQLTGLQ